MILTLLFLGDIVGLPGREALKQILPRLIAEHQPDFVIANAENIAHGAGLKREKLEEMMAAGVDAFTSGDHTFDVTAVSEVLDDPAFPLVRPGNWPGDAPGRGWRIIEKNGKKLLLMNALGRVFIRTLANDYFAAIERMLAEATTCHGEAARTMTENSSRPWDFSFLDFHAEATSEKRAVAEYFDSRIDAIIGTHTHVQTNDAQTLPHGTGFLSDAGMCGAQDSILGAETEGIIRHQRMQTPMKRQIPKDGPALVCGCLAKINQSRTTMELVQVRDIRI